MRKKRRQSGFVSAAEAEAREVADADEASEGAAEALRLPAAHQPLLPPAEAPAECAPPASPGGGAGMPEPAAWPPTPPAAAAPLATLLEAAVQQLQEALACAHRDLGAAEASAAHERAQRLALARRCAELEARLAERGGEGGAAGAPALAPAPLTSLPAWAACPSAAQPVAVPIAPPPSACRAPQGPGASAASVGGAGGVVPAFAAADQRVRTVPALLEMAAAAALHAAAEQLAQADAAHAADGADGCADGGTDGGADGGADGGVDGAARRAGSAELLGRLRACLLPVLQQLARVDVFASQLRASDEQAHAAQLQGGAAEGAAEGGAEEAEAGGGGLALPATADDAGGALPPAACADACAGGDDDGGAEAGGGSALAHAAVRGLQAERQARQERAAALAELAGGAGRSSTRASAAAAAVAVGGGDCGGAGGCALAGNGGASQTDGHANGHVNGQGGAAAAWQNGHSQAHACAAFAAGAPGCAGGPADAGAPPGAGGSAAGADLRRQERRKRVRVSFATHDLSAVQPPNVFVLGSERSHTRLIEMLVELRERQLPLLELLQQEPACVTAVRGLAASLAELAADGGLRVALPMRSAAAFYAAEFAELAGAEGRCVGAPVLQWRLQQLLLSSLRFHLAMVLNEESGPLHAMRQRALGALKAARLPLPLYNCDNFAALLTSALRSHRWHANAPGSTLLRQLLSDADAADGGARAGAPADADGAPAAGAQPAAPTARVPTAAEADPAEREGLRAFATAQTILEAVFLGTGGTTEVEEGGGARADGSGGEEASRAGAEPPSGAASGEGGALPPQPQHLGGGCGCGDDAAAAPPASEAGAEQPQPQPADAPATALAGSAAAAVACSAGAPAGAPADPALADASATFESVCGLPENAPFHAVLTHHAAQIRAIGAEDELHLAVLAELPAFRQALAAGRRPAQRIIAWLQAGAKRRKRAPNARQAR